MLQKNSRSIVCVFIVAAFLCGLSCAFLHTSLHNFSHTYSQDNSVSSNFGYKNRIKNRIKNPILPQKNTAVRTSWIKSDSIASYVMSEIRNARSRLYDDRSMYFEGVPLQDYVRRFGLTKQAYVNNIQYDSENEEDAYRRAQETAQHGKIGHFGPDGVSDPDYSGRKAWGENLSWGLDLYGSMKGWIGDEEAPLRSARGYFTEEDSHLYQILNPSNLSFAYGEAPGGPYGIVGVMTLSEYHGNIDYSVGKIGPSGPSEDEKHRAAEEEERKKKEEEERKARKEEEERLRLARKAHKAHKKHHKVVKALKKISAFNWILATTIASVVIVVIAAVACGIWYFLLRKKKRAELGASEDVAKELSEKLSEDSTEEKSEENTEETSEDTSEKLSEEKSEESSEKPTEDSAESDSSEDSTEANTEELSEE